MAHAVFAWGIQDGSVQRTSISPDIRAPHMSACSFRSWIMSSLACVCVQTDITMNRIKLIIAPLKLTFSVLPIFALIKTCCPKRANFLERILHIFPTILWIFNRNLHPGPKYFRATVFDGRISWWFWHLISYFKSQVDQIDNQYIKKAVT